MSAVDPADLQAHARAQLGLSRELEQARRVKPHPSHGGSGGYDVWFREEQLARAQAGEDVDVSVSSLRRWGERLFIWLALPLSSWVTHHLPHSSP